MQRVMAEMFDVSQLPELTVHGRTDRAIIMDLFAASGLELNSPTYQEFTSRYHDELVASLNICGGQLLAGVAGLLPQLADQSESALGLLTGNSMPAAMTKVRHFGIAEYFTYGGYGHEHADREGVARAALADCQNWARPNLVQPHETWVIGDTVRDVQCARSIGANVIAVATGGSTRQELDAAGADVVLDDLTDPRPVLDICRDAATR